MVLSIVSCGAKEETQLTTPSGYAYTHAKVGTVQVKEGDYVAFTLTVKGSDGTVLQEMAEGPNMPTLQIPTADKPLPQPNPILEALATASVGDTIVLTMPMDSMPGQAGNPQFAGMTHIEYITVVKSSEDEAAYKANMEVKRLEQEMKAEENKKRIPEVEAMVNKTLADYKAGKLKLESLDGGLKYVLHEEGDGIDVNDGMRAAVSYYGVTMDGKMFDNSFRAGGPYTFTVGRGEVIKGWDIGIAALKVGSKATLFLPYDLAYGEAGSPPNIGPKSDLVFYVEVADAN